MCRVLELACHPDTPPGRVAGVAVALHVEGGRWTLDFTVSGGAPLLAPVAMPERADGLWQSTCFELFVMGDNGGYTEFNFAPSTRWAAYRFDAYRQGMRDATLATPRIEPTGAGVRVTLDFPPPEKARISLCAVIEEEGGTKSYWALAHPPGKPDFHHPACFALELPAPSAP